MLEMVQDILLFLLFNKKPRQAPNEVFHAKDVGMWWGMYPHTKSSTKIIFS